MCCTTKSGRNTRRAQHWSVLRALRDAHPPRAWRQAHFDYFHDQLNTQNGGQRVATVLLYLCADLLLVL